ncbi:MAG: hypothetical protein JSU90_02725 [Nitrospiraceae bacterium]|nr:MAG: hypothetical protein JSU90_02725 [Nitrospiraceae bacterium]
MDRDMHYQVSKENDRYVFRTSSFRAEKTSVLHAGVYSREFTSMLLASAVCIAAYMVMHMARLSPPFLRYILVLVLFAAVFLGANTFVFRDKSLEAVFDRGSRTIRITWPGILTGRSETISFDRVHSVDVGSRQYVPENIDGIDFVQKISAQHGSAVPGLGEVEEFVTLSLLLTDGSERTIYAVKINGGKTGGEPPLPLKEIRSFLNM